MKIPAMKNKKLYIIPGLLLILFICISPKIFESKFKLIKKIDKNGDYITSDKLANIYLIKGNNLSKYNIKGNILKTYSNISSGDISFVDASDPFKILLFYKDFSRIVFLDNTLSKKGDAISLVDLNLELSSLACSSYQNGFWLYDPKSFQLIRIDQNLKINQKSGDITQLTGKQINPNFLTEINNFVYLNDPEAGILVFDEYGSYYKTLPFKNLTAFQIIDNKLIYCDSTKISSYNLKTFEHGSIPLPLSRPVSMRINLNTLSKHLFLLTQTSLNIYSISEE